jgi:hypothetical protein
LAHCELNFAVAPGLFLTDNRKIVFIASLLTGIAFKWYQALEGDPFRRSYPAFHHEFLSTFDYGDLLSHSVAALHKLEQTGSVAKTKKPDKNTQNVIICSAITTTITTT